MNARLFRTAPLAALLLVLGCSHQDRRSARCPPSWPIPQSVTVFRPGTPPDLADELYTVALIDAEGDCTYSTKTHDWCMPRWI